VTLLAHGLRPQVTGIERVVLSAADQVLRARPDARLRVVVDALARWPAGLPVQVDVVPVGRARAELLHPRSGACAGATLVHSLGPALPSAPPGGRVYTVHDWGPLTGGAMPLRARAVWGAAITQGVWRCDALHLVSRETRSATPRSLRRLVARRRVTVGGVGAPAVEPGPPMPRGEALLHVGAPVRRRRLDLLLHAVAESPDLTVDLVGDDLVDLGGSRGARVLGRLSDRDLEATYRHARALVLLSEYEGMGLPVAEAAALGTPSVVSAAVARAQPGWVLPYLTVVDPEDAVALVAALRGAGRSATTPPLGSPELRQPDEALLQLYRRLLPVG